jgi:hypothetical protein
VTEKTAVVFITLPPLAFLGASSTPHLSWPTQPDEIDWRTTWLNQKCCGAARSVSVAKMGEN